MPVTARRSQRFYEKFGDEFTQELADWCNQVDATYRDHSRELNDLNFARSDAKVEQRFAQADARLEQRLGLVKNELEQSIRAVEVKLGALKSELIKWMFVFWTGTALANLLLRR